MFNETMRFSSVRQLSKNRFEVTLSEEDHYKHSDDCYLSRLRKNEFLFDIYNRDTQWMCISRDASSFPHKFILKKVRNFNHKFKGIVFIPEIPSVSESWIKL